MAGRWQSRPPPHLEQAAAVEARAARGALGRRQRVRPRLHDTVADRARLGAVELAIDVGPPEGHGVADGPVLVEHVAHLQHPAAPAALGDAVAAGALDRHLPQRVRRRHPQQQLHAAFLLRGGGGAVASDE